MKADIALRHGSPAQHMIDKMGLDINEVNLRLTSDKQQTDLSLDASIPAIEPNTSKAQTDSTTLMRLPAAKAALLVTMKEGSTFASLAADSKLTDGAMSLHGLRTDADLRFDIERTGNDLNGVGRLKMDKMAFGETELGTRVVNMSLARSELYPNAFKAEVQPDDIPLDIADSIIKMADLDLQGAIRAHAALDGFPDRFDLSAEVLPLNVSAHYKPYNVQLGLGETRISTVCLFTERIARSSR